MTARRPVAPDARPGLVRRVRARLRAVGAAIHAVLGVPDYDRYLAHMREHHPDVPPLSRGEHLGQELEARHTRPGSRCC